MSTLKEKWRNKTKFSFAFFILALVFLLVGLGTLGTPSATGSSYELKTGTTVVFRLQKSEEREDQTELKYIYFNFGNMRTEPGTIASVRVRRSNSSATSWYSSHLGEAKLANVTAEEETTKGILFNWFTPYDLTETAYGISSYPYYELTAPKCDILINEIVFVANDGSVIQAEIDRDKSKNIDIEKAAALLDRQHKPVAAQSSFFRLGEEEAYTMMTIAEMRAGKTYSDAAVYTVDKNYNAFGVDLLALSTLIFGMSPFGLRILPFLASFGCLLIGYYFAKKLFASDKAGFVFGLLYALCGSSLAFGHLGTPLTIGLFFWFASLYYAYLFYSKGMEKAEVKSAIPLICSGLAAAAAICVNGVYFVPVLGTVALFVFGMLRQQKAKAYYLEKAAKADEAAGVQETVSEEAASPAEGEAPAKTETARVKEEYTLKNRIAAAMFATSLVVGFVLITLFAILPVYSAYTKAYDNPAAPSLNIFVLLWQGLKGGFVGGNVYHVTQTGWRYFYETFVGQGSFAARTFASVNAVAAVGAAMAVVYAIVRMILIFAKKQTGKQARAELRGIIIPLAGFFLCLITAAFAQPNAGFVFMAYVFAFFLIAGGIKSLDALCAKAEEGGTVKLAIAYSALKITAIVLLALWFAITVPFTFSIPLPEAVFTALFG